MLCLESLERLVQSFHHLFSNYCPYIARNIAFLATAPNIIWSWACENEGMQKEGLMLWIYTDRFLFCATIICSLPGLLCNCDARCCVGTINSKQMFLCMIIDQMINQMSLLRLFLHAPLTPLTCFAALSYGSLAPLARSVCGFAHSLCLLPRWSVEIH